MRKNIEFRQQCCQNCKKKIWERRKLSDVMGREKKWISVMRLSKFLSCLAFTNCGNQVAEIVGNWGERKYELWQPSCRKWEEKKKKGIVVGEILGRNLKKKKKVLYPQHFYNKTQIVSCYYFKFEFNTEITFLIQQ